MSKTFKPPKSAINNAKKGLDFRKKYGRGGLTPAEAKSYGIDSGITRAKRIASGKLSKHDVRRMSAFNRHRGNYNPSKKMADGGPTAGTIAWLLWGGTSGVNWAKKKSAAMGAESFEAECKHENWERGETIEPHYIYENGELVDEVNLYWVECNECGTIGDEFIEGEGPTRIKWEAESFEAEYNLIGRRKPRKLSLKVSDLKEALENANDDADVFVGDITPVEEEMIGEPIVSAPRGVWTNGEEVYIVGATDWIHTEQIDELTWNRVNRAKGAESFEAEEYTVEITGFMDKALNPTTKRIKGTEQELKDELFDFHYHYDRLIDYGLDGIEDEEEAMQRLIEKWNKQSIETICDDDDMLTLITSEKRDAESFEADDDVFTHSVVLGFKFKYYTKQNPIYKKKEDGSFNLDPIHIIKLKILILREMDLVGVEYDDATITADSLLFKFNFTNEIEAQKFSSYVREYLSQNEKVEQLQQYFDKADARVMTKYEAGILFSTLMDWSNKEYLIDFLEYLLKLEEYDYDYSLQYIRERGVDINEQDDYGVSLKDLMLAEKMGYQSMLEELVNDLKNKGRSLDDVAFTLSADNGLKNQTRTSMFAIQQTVESGVVNRTMSLQFMRYQGKLQAIDDFLYYVYGDEDTFIFDNI